jgi:glycosyltransferase involved in cell wall biosynthesis
MSNVLGDKYTIGIDARFWGEAGPGRYTKAILAHLEKIDVQNKYYVFLRKKGFEQYTPQNPNFTKVLADFKWYSFEEQILYLFLLLKYRLDLYYVPHFNVPILYPGKLVTAIPDIIMHAYSTHRTSTHISPKHFIKKVAYHLTVLIAVVRSCKIIVPTKATMREFLKFYKFTNAAKYVIASEGIDPSFTVETTEEYDKQVLEDLGIRGDYLLYVGSMYRHKNPYKLIDAFAVLKKSYGYKGQLVLVGKKDYFSRCVSDYVTKKNLVKEVLLPGLKKYVTDKEVIALSKNADLYVFPSLKEGFSLTPLEAQAWGLPCAISNIECHKEVYGDSVAYFDPNDLDNISKVLNEVLSDLVLKESLVKKGYERVGMYSWDDTAKRTFEVFVECLG